ncbi:predicted protein [Lichtheimia corymbifera JMRC:FSU:9682]|uniref:Uncharacterized protein n=1 Tax=Lichtheimia corymbifera JMRC:FSU:9682 TaxID=1263082 RepID=A0A068RP49_9FUNG|nr:predicted protein [Lichtheimia corymbifera JMRC:FSU:9682]
MLYDAMDPNQGGMLKTLRVAMDHGDQQEQHGYKETSSQDHWSSGTGWPRNILTNIKNQSIASLVPRLALLQYHPPFVASLHIIIFQYYIHEFTHFLIKRACFLCLIN